MPSALGDTKSIILCLTPKKIIEGNGHLLEKSRIKITDISLGSI